MTEILALSNIKCIGLPGSKSPSVYEWTSFFHSDMSPPLPKNAKFCLICDLALKSEILNKLGEQRWWSYVLPEFSTVLPRPPWEPSSGLPRPPWEPSCNIPVCKFVFLTCYKTLNYFTHTHTHTPGFKNEMWQRGIMRPAVKTVLGKPRNLMRNYRDID